MALYLSTSLQLYTISYSDLPFYRIFNLHKSCAWSSYTILCLRPKENRYSFIQYHMVVPMNPCFGMEVCLHLFWTSVLIGMNVNLHATATLIARKVSTITVEWVGHRAHLNDSENCERRLSASPCLSVCPYACNSSAASGRIFMKFYIWVFVENLSRKFKFH
jgi:hypothetical protein